MNINIRARGFTLIEILIALAVLAILLLVVFGLMNSTFKSLNADQSRLGANRNARSVMDILGSDVRQAGERLTSDFSAILLTSDANGNTVLTLRRGLVTGPLPLCSILPAAGNPYVNGNSPSRLVFGDGSNNLPLACINSLQNLSEWDNRISTYGAQTGFIYEVETGGSAFVKVTGTSTDTTTNEQRVIIDGFPSFDPTRANSTDSFKDIRIYLIEERKYSVSGEQLMLGIDNQAAQVAAPGVVSFTVTPYIKAASGAVNATTLPFPDAGQDWKDLAYLELNLVVKDTNGQKTVQRTLSERYTPRNAGSAD